MTSIVWRTPAWTGLLPVTQSFCRERVRSTIPFPLDLDLLFVGSMVMSTPDLELPHPELMKGDFVVEPLAEIAGDFTLPLLGKTMREFKTALVGSGDESFVLRTFPSEI